MKDKEKKLIEFAERALTTLENQEEWSSDTPEDIADIAMELGLAKTDNYGFFKVVLD